MKKSFISILAVAGILISGCALEEAPSSEGSIRAIMENDETRTSVTDEGKFTWSAGDLIWLETTSSSVIGTLSTGAGTANATFSYDSFFGEMTGKAVYPYNSGHSVKGDVLDMVLPASYDLGTSLQNTNAALYGVNVDGTLKFNHLAGVMRFKFKNVPAGVNQFVITLDKKINGTFEADLTADYPVLETSETEVESEKTVTFNFDALTQTSDIMIYVPLPLGTYNSLGLALNNAEKSVWTYSNTVTNTITRKKLILMPTVTLSGSVDGDIEGDGSEEEPMPEPQEGDYVDEYGINHGQGIKIGEIVWAPVNCGYHATDYKYGKLYQWGRKYGQGYDGSLYDSNFNKIGQFADASIPEKVQESLSLSDAQSKSNENVFFLGYVISNIYYDWVNPLDEVLWNSGTESSPIKNVENDPCPSGWRVPTCKELEGLTGNYSEWTENDKGQGGYWVCGTCEYSSASPKIFLPAAGHRNSEGDADGRGYSANYWTSALFITNLEYEATPTTIYRSYNLGFRRKSTIAKYNNDRTEGYSVRCVKEGAASPTPSEPEIINLSENGTANSYIVSEAGSYKIVPTKGNSNESVGTISSVEVLWESFGTDVTPNVGDLVKNVKYSDGAISFATPSTFKEGNAVIAAKDASGNILWSWHIWLTDEPQGQVYYNNAGTMMDRNLGATSATPGDVGALGLLYQWGRKDPFLGSSSIQYDMELAKSTITWPSSVSSDSSTGTIGYATSNPTTFITYNTNNSDWYYTGSSSTDNSRWTTSATSKSIYDPCPAGWRVPDGGYEGIWSTALGSSSHFIDSSFYDDTNEGMNFSSKFGSSSTIWYPTSHNRNYADGNIRNGGSALYWSASPSSHVSYNVYYLNINDSGFVSPLGNGSRAYGSSVRCLKEID